MTKNTELPTFTLRPLSILLYLLLALSRVVSWPIWLLLPLLPILTSGRTLDSRLALQVDEVGKSAAGLDKGELIETDEGVALDKDGDVETIEAVSIDQ